MSESGSEMSYADVVASGPQQSEEEVSSLLVPYDRRITCLCIGLYVTQDQSLTRNVSILGVRSILITITITMETIQLTMSHIAVRTPLTRSSPPTNPSSPSSTSTPELPWCPATSRSRRLAFPPTHPATTPTPTGSPVNPSPAFRSRPRHKRSA